MSDKLTVTEVRQAVRERYAASARGFARRKGGSCCSTSNCCDQTSGFYQSTDLQGLPETAAGASLGCGNPLLLAELRPGEVVLDLGSGAGLDVLLSAKRVAPAGMAYGLDMTDEMLELARHNARLAGVSNVEFLKGHIEEIPLPDASVDVIISNCVINLSADKDAVLREAYRVLRPGGRLAIADIVVRGQPFSDEARQALTLWSCCITGAITDTEYRQKLAEAGFVDIGMEAIQTYGPEDLPAGEAWQRLATLVGPDTQVLSAMVAAHKPAND